MTLEVLKTNPTQSKKLPFFETDKILFPQRPLFDVVKSPLRYPGGKSRAVKIVCSIIPSNVKEICSPFLGGGSIELACASQGMHVYGYDIFSPLVEFWQCLLINREKLADLTEKYYPLSKEYFYELQRLKKKFISKYERAAVFYVLNRSSFSGSTLSGGMSPGHPRFTPSSIERLRHFFIDNFTVEKKDFKSSIWKHKSALLYLDPPYLIKHSLYGKNGNTHKNFDHISLAKILKARNKWILSYNNCPEILNLYEKYAILFPKWQYGMSNDKDSKEVLILSHDIAESNGLRKL